jgi:hypothetical protein
MKKNLSFFLLSCSFVLLTLPCVFSATPLKLSDVISHQKTYDQKSVHLKAKISQVCEASGCWMIIKDLQNPEQSAKVTFTRDTLKVAPSDLGKQVELEGKFTVKKIGDHEAYSVLASEFHLAP